MDTSVDRRELKDHPSSAGEHDHHKGKLKALARVLARQAALDYVREGGILDEGGRPC